MGISLALLRSAHIDTLTTSLLSLGGRKGKDKGKPIGGCIKNQAPNSEPCIWNSGPKSETLSGKKKNQRHLIPKP